MVEKLQVAGNVKGDNAAKDTGARNENEIGTGTKDQDVPAVIGGTSNQPGEKVSS